MNSKLAFVSLVCLVQWPALWLDAALSNRSDICYLGYALFMCFFGSLYGYFLGQKSIFFISQLSKIVVIFCTVWFCIAAVTYLSSKDSHLPELMANMFHLPHPILVSLIAGFVYALIATLSVSVGTRVFESRNLKHSLARKFN